MGTSGGSALVWSDSLWGGNDRLSLSGIIYEVEGSVARIPAAVPWSKVRRQICVGEFQRYLINKYGTIEGSWSAAFKNLDKSGHINYTRFCHGCKAAGYVGNVAKLWAMLDEDRSGEITLNELLQDVGRPDELRFDLALNAELPQSLSS